MEGRSTNGGTPFSGKIEAYKWQEMIETGQVGSLGELAKLEGVDRSYIGRMLKLTTLAPDIVEAILQGNERDGISLEKLRKNLPVCWGEQRQQWLSIGQSNGR